MRKEKAGAKLLFKTNSNDELQIFLELIQKILKNKDSIVETRLNTINIKLYGKREEIEILSNRLKDAHGLVKSAFLLNKEGKRQVDLTLLSWLTGYHVDGAFFSFLLSELDAGEMGIGKVLITSLNLKELLRKYKQAHLTFTSTLPQEHKDIRKLITILMILFPNSSEEDIVRFGINNGLFEKKNGKLIFRAEKKQIIATYKDRFIELPKKNNISNTKSSSSSNFFGGGRIILKKER